MARVRVRSNVYAAMPILASIIMGFGIYVTWVEVAKYHDPDMKPQNVPKPDLPAVIPADPVPTDAPRVSTAAPAERPTTEVAPTEGDELAPPDEGPAPPGPGPVRPKEEDEL